MNKIYVIELDDLLVRTFYLDWGSFKSLFLGNWQLIWEIECFGWYVFWITRVLIRSRDKRTYELIPWVLKFQSVFYKSLFIWKFAELFHLLEILLIFIRNNMVYHHFFRYIFRYVSLGCFRSSQIFKGFILKWKFNPKTYLVLTAPTIPLTPPEGPKCNRFGLVLILF